MKWVVVLGGFVRVNGLAFRLLFGGRVGDRGILSRGANPIRGIFVDGENDGLKVAVRSAENQQQRGRSDIVAGLSIGAALGRYIVDGQRTTEQQADYKEISHGTNG